eukprot:5677013-Amphidinium_carterae.1
MTKEERRQVLEEVRTVLDEEVRNFWEPVLTPMGYLMCVNKVHNYAQFTQQFVRVGSKEPETGKQPIAAAIQLGTSRVSSVVSFPALESPRLVGFQSRRSLLSLILLVLLWKISLLVLGMCSKTRCRSSLNTASTTV